MARTELDAAVEGRAPRVNARRYGFTDGLRTEEYNFGRPPGFKDEKGRLWFASLKGAVRVDPARLVTNTVPPAVHVEGVTVDGVESRTPGVTIPPGALRFELRYGAATFLAPRRARFSFKLEGYDADWVDAGHARAAHYTRLPPGAFRFRVRAANADGAWNMDGAEFAFTVEPYFWQTRPFLVGVVLLLVASAWLAVQLRIRGLRRRARDLEEQVTLRTAELAREKARTDQLLLNVLPAPIAERLKAGESPIADAFGAVSIVFSDIVGFTDLSARITPAELVDLLNEVFSAFDHLADVHGVEKIKTIGDAYMVVAGVPSPRADHAEAACAMAMDMIRALAEVNARRGTELRVRIGIHAGPVVAGVIGRRKFSYDLWGDAVNTASRMESHGAPGRVHVSHATRDLLGDAWLLEDRGTIQVKGKGEMHTWYVTGRAAAGAA